MLPFNLFAESSTMDAKLLDVLVCPVCKGKLIYCAEAQTLTCKPCALVYPIKDGIPVMLEEAAQPIPPEGN